MHTMPFLLTAVLSWLRRRWPRTGLNRQEGLGLGLLAVGGVLLAWFGTPSASGPSLVLGSLFVLLLAVLFRRAWLTLLGPLVAHEIIRTTRRSHFNLLRIPVYCLLVLMPVNLVLWMLAKEFAHEPTQFTVSTGEMFAFAGLFVYSFLIGQLLLLTLLTPGYLASIIPEEKERGTLEFLLTTDLRNREIVLGKLLARLANLLLILLTSLPIVVLLQALGGLDPLLVLGGYAATAMTMIGLAGPSILNSVNARRPRQAIVLTTLETVAYLVVLPLAQAWIPLVPLLNIWIPGLGMVNITSLDVLVCLNAGNPITLVIETGQKIASGVPVAATTLPGRLLTYSLFHGILFLVCVSWASARLRTVFKKQVYGQVRRPATRSLPIGRKWVGVGRWPMIWKEICAERGLRLHWLGRLLVILLVAGSFLPLLSILIKPPGGPLGSIQRMKDLCEFVYFAGGGIACLFLLQVAVHASLAITSERDRRTLEGLLTTPLSAADILLGKWLGSIASVRWGWLWLGTIWGIGVWSGVLHPLALLLLLTAWAIYAAVLALVGLWFSLVSWNGLRATGCTLFLALLLLLNFAVSLPFMWFKDGLADPDFWLILIARIQQGLSPLVSLVRLLPFPRHPLAWQVVQPSGITLDALLGLVAWAGAGMALWFMLNRRFRRSRGAGGSVKE